MTTAKLPAPLRNSVAGSSTETKAKVFILDTCILLTDPLAMFKFGGENHVVIPVEVLEEIDNIKTEQATLRGRNAREVSRLLTDIFRDLRAMKEGVTIEGGGKLQILIRDADTH